LPPLCLPGRRGDERLRTLAYEVTVAEARERERIAAGLHDDIGQVLAILALKLGELNEAVSGSGSASLIAELRALVSQAARATRSATFELSSPVLHQLGLQAAIESLVPRTEALGGVKVVVAGRLPDLPLPEQVLAIVFRVARELIANVVKHARARAARITLHADSQWLLVVVSDDGVGFDAESPRAAFGPEGGYGLVSAEAQMQALGGQLDIESAPGRGTRATLCLPLPAQPVEGH
jgi:signal transduction histidine kinase